MELSGVSVGQGWACLSWAEGSCELSSRAGIWQVVVNKGATRSMQLGLNLPQPVASLCRSAALEGRALHPLAQFGRPTLLLVCVHKCAWCLYAILRAKGFLTWERSALPQEGKGGFPSRQKETGETQGFQKFTWVCGLVLYYNAGFCWGEWACFIHPNPGGCIPLPFPGIYHNFLIPSLQNSKHNDHQKCGRPADTGKQKLCFLGYIL